MPDPIRIGEVPETPALRTLRRGLSESPELRNGLRLTVGLAITRSTPSA